MVLTVQAQAGDGASALERSLGPGIDVAADSETGAQITFVGTGPGTVIPLRATSPRGAALEAGERFGPRFGLGENAALNVSALDRLRDGRSAVLLQKMIGGLPVLGGQLAVGLDPSGDVLSIGGEPEPGTAVDPTASSGGAEAAATAISAVARAYGVATAGLDTTAPELSVYDPRILGGPGLEIPRPVWRLTVRGNGP